MNMQPLIEWGKRFKGFLGIVAFMLIVVLAIITYLFKQGSLDQVLAGFGKLTSDQFLTVIYLALGLPFIIIVLLILLSYRSTRPQQIGQKEMILYIQVSNSQTKRRLIDAEVLMNFHGTNSKHTDEKGEVVFTFPEVYRGEMYTIEVFKENYLNKSIKGQLGKKPNVQLYLDPDRKQPETTTAGGNAVHASYIDDTIATSSTENKEKLRQGVSFHRSLPATPLSNSTDLVFYFKMPLRDPSEFYGRELLRTTLITRSAHGGSTAIIGPRQIGKTWLMQYLSLMATKHPALGPQFRVGYINATNPRCDAIASFAQYTLEALKFTDSHFTSLNDRLDKLAQAIKESQVQSITPILCIDEFDAFDKRPEFGADFLQGLRAMTQEGLVLITASRKTPTKVISDRLGITSPLLNVFEHLYLKPFDERDAVLFAQEKSEQAGFDEQEYTDLLEYAVVYGPHEERQWPPLKLQLVGQMLLNDKRVAQESGRQPHPQPAMYRMSFQQRVEEQYREAID